MQDKETVYRIRYTPDNRVRSVHVTEEPRTNEDQRTMIALLIIAAGLLLGWWLL